MNIIITDMSGISVFLMPIVPVNTTITDNGSSSAIDTLNGNLNLIGNQKLKQIEWSSVFPASTNYISIHQSAFVNALVYIGFLKTMKKLKLPVRLIMTTNDKIPTMNMLASINELNYSMDKSGDINYRIKLTEFPESFFGIIHKNIENFNYIKDTKLKKERELILAKWKLISDKSPKLKN